MEFVDYEVWQIILILVLGTAFFPLQSCMNHSCEPNAKAFKREEVHSEHLCRASYLFVIMLCSDWKKD